MRTRLLIASLSLVVVASSLFAQNFTNANVRTADARGGFASAIGTRDGWYAWSVPMAGGGSICCWTGKGSGCCGGCSLGGNKGWSINRDDKGIGRQTTDVTIALQLEGGEVSRVQMFDSECPTDGRGNAITVLSNVDPASSISWLAGKARGYSGGHGNSVVAAIAQHDHPSALPTLERLTADGSPDKVREDAIFWIGQRGGERGATFLTNFLRTDDSTSLRKKAVFSLSQNKSASALPALINVARNDKSDQIRREAIFWLGQHAGSKAADELRRAVDEDPDDDVKEHAVFAISQLPRERSVPMLIDLVRNHKSPAVRKKAMFWLTQTGDDRALDVIEAILEK